MMGVKITLGQARDQGADTLDVHCENAACGRSASIPLADALARWGEARQLDDIPFRCASCGGVAVDARPGYQRGPGGLRG